jgi:hypothetical protein
MDEVVTIVVPVSRSDNLSLFFTSLENLQCDARKTNLLAIVDGSDDLYLEVRNFVQNSRFNEKLTVKFASAQKARLRGERRKRIADIHNYAKTIIGDCKYVFSLEDDTIIKRDALAQLLRTYREYPHAGLVSGLELGRWGTYYIGAWKLDDIYNPTLVQSLMPESPQRALVEVDGTGLYCLLTKREHYVDHFFKDLEDGAMGPDIEFGVSLRREGYTNIVDWRVQCVHMSKDGQKILMQEQKPQLVEWVKNEQEWLFFEK